MNFHRLGLSALITTSLLLSTSTETQAAQDRYLGRVRLSYAERDLDVLRIQRSCPTPIRSNFNAIRLQIEQGAADIQGLAVQYGNGRWDRLSVRQNLGPRTTSRWIDLRGDRRCIRAIAILGDTDNRSRRPAVVRVYARKY